MSLISKLSSHVAGTAMIIVALSGVGIIILLEFLTTEKTLKDVVSEVRDTIGEIYNETKEGVVRFATKKII